MDTILQPVTDLNQEVLSKSNNVGGKSAYEVVAMAGATSIQNELAMHAGFETTSNTVLNLAMQKIAEAAAVPNQKKVNMWTRVMNSILDARKTETTSVDTFNKAIEELVENFPQGGN